ncbi:nitronate monooxygenase [Paucidesulfovibrio gracilis DSM 16080]|uniref:Nitronate monooxygenase n=1 Tax=Paucidesulfovibrio gracilis DSM 16080 TaxID=1121449 RepID=A0A1T4XWY4_9BACT|nr:nitronate monooxygenase [Paucidesulfovibrio gracilis DSM 16080]
MTLPSLHIGDLVARLPIVQGGMGVGISLSGLASAVANEGGVGVIATPMIGMYEPDRASNPEEADLRALKTEIRKARSLSNGIIGVNIMCALTNFAELVRTSVREGIDVIFAGAGLPLDLPAHLPEDQRENTHTKLVPIVSSGRAAKLICKKWLKRFDRLPDAFVVEGPKAGGHLGFKPEQIDDPNFALEKILPQTIEAVHEFEMQARRPIPVIAAGGVYSGADIVRFMDMGAAGVQMGTRFVATEECDADIEFKKAFVNAKKEDLRVIQSPVGLPGRAVGNVFLDKVKNGLLKPHKCPYKCLASCPQEDGPYCIAKALMNAKRGLLKHGFAFAGANAYLVEKIVTVRDLFCSLKEEAARSRAEAAARRYIESARQYMDLVTDSAARYRLEAKQYLEQMQAQANRGKECARQYLDQMHEEATRRRENAREYLEQMQEKVSSTLQEYLPEGRRTDPGEA